MKTTIGLLTVAFGWLMMSASGGDNFATNNVIDGWVSITAGSTNEIPEIYEPSGDYVAETNGMTFFTWVRQDLFIGDELKEASEKAQKAGMNLGILAGTIGGYIAGYLSCFILSLPRKPKQ